MTGDEKVKKSRDPIFTTCLVIFAIAVVAILGVFVNDHYIQTDDTEVAYGDKVVVNYTGSFYGYVGDENAVVFDTSYSSIGNDDKIIKSNSFTKTSYNTFTITVGNNGALKGFEESVIGHKVGDKVKVMIPAGEGYLGPDSVTVQNNSGSVPVTMTMPQTAFKALYKDVTLVAGSGVMFETVYGWDATATLAGTEVIITNMPEAGQTYDYIGNEDSDFGNVKFQVRSIGTSVEFTYVFEDTHSVGANGEIQMIELDFGTETWYVTNVDNGSFTYKTSENANIDMYFEITIVSIN